MNTAELRAALEAITDAYDEALTQDIFNEDNGEHPTPECLALVSNARAALAALDAPEKALRAIIADADKRPGGDNPLQEISRGVLCDARLLLIKLEGGS